jgi:hypothetical protein
MSERDWHPAKRTMDARVISELSQAQSRRLAQIARQPQPTRLAWQCRWLICELGYRMVALGAWLESFSLARAQPMEVKVARREGA